MKRSPIKRSSTAAKRKARFARAFGSKERVRQIQQSPCLVCGKVPSEAAHVRSRGAGGGPDDLVPLCSGHHSEQHTAGTKTFEKRHGLDLRAEADKHAQGGSHDLAG